LFFLFVVAVLEKEERTGKGFLEQEQSQKVVTMK